jgi:hypothetical protein
MASSPLLWRGLHFGFFFGLRLDLGLIILVLIGRRRSTSSLGSTPASTNSENRCLALSMASASRSSTTSSASSDNNFFLGSLFEAVHQTVGSPGGHLLEKIRKKSILALGVRHTVWSINILKYNFIIIEHSR